MILVVFDCFLVCNDVPFSSLDLVSRCFLLVVSGSQEPSLGGRGVHCYWVFMFSRSFLSMYSASECVWFFGLFLLLS